jgi:aldose 1-epimerase
MVPLTGAQVPLTGAQYDLSAGDYQATITELGAGLRRLEHRGRPAVVGYEPDVLPPAGAGQLLCPWPNRVDHGHYAIDGTEYQLDLSEPANGNAIHGLTRWASWAPAPADASPGGEEITLRLVLLGHQGYPFALELDASYRLEADHGLQVSISARNLGSVAAPYGTGSHPYLTTGAATADECELTVPAGLWQPSGERGIPAGAAQDVTGTDFDFRTRRPIGGTQLDHALTGLDRGADGRTRARLSSAGTEVALWAGPGYEWLQVFTGDTLGPSHRRKAVAIEPMTCPPNAFVSGVDLLMLEPGDSVTHTWGIEVTPA